MTFWRVTFDDGLYHRNAGEVAVYAPNADSARSAVAEYLKNETLYARPYIVTEVVEVNLGRPAVFETETGPQGEWPRRHREPGPEDGVAAWLPDHFELLLLEEQPTDEVLAAVRREFRELLAGWPTDEDVAEPSCSVREDLRFGQLRTLTLIEMWLGDDVDRANRFIPRVLRWAERTADALEISWEVNMHDRKLGVIAPGIPASAALREATRF